MVRQLENVSPFNHSKLKMSIFYSFSHSDGDSRLLTCFDYTQEDINIYVHEVYVLGRVLSDKVAINNFVAAVVT